MYYIYILAGTFQMLSVYLVCLKTKKRWIMSHSPKLVLSLGTKSLALKVTTAELIQTPAPVN